MPNWCLNKLVVRGEGAALTQFVADVGDPHACDEDQANLAFHIHVPAGDGDPAAKADAWGTKWEPSGVERTLTTPGEARYVFDTAWSPPIAWVEAVAHAHPHLEFDLVWAEPGMGVAGHHRFCDGAPASQDGWDAESDDVAERLREQDFDVWPEPLDEEDDTPEPHAGHGRGAHELSVAGTTGRQALARRRRSPA